MNLDMVPQQATRIVAQQAAGQWVLLDVSTGQYYSLDQVGGRIWQLCDGTRSVRQIAEVVCDEYDAAGQSVEDDVAGLVSELVGESLLV
jgi:coenzyme PQQ synthesis protein D (PqqD)